jgi:hypothetical protein
MSYTAASQAVYTIYGVAFTSNFPFTVPLPVTPAPPALEITLVAAPPFTPAWEQLQPAGHSRIRTASGEPWLTCYEFDECEVRRLAQIADFYLYADRIFCHLLDPEQVVDAEIGLLGTVLSRWLERRGVAMLHASAVVTPAGAVAFLASSQSGKSTLAASFVDAGALLLTDDILPVCVEHGVVMAAPGYPQMRMWPEVAQHFLGEYDALPLVHPKLTKRCVRLPQPGWGAFCGKPQPLVAIYLPARDTAEPPAPAIASTALGPAEALFTLVGHCFAGPGVAGVAHQQRRMELLRTVAQKVAVRRLSYPSGYAHLPQVRSAILKDVHPSTVSRDPQPAP